MSEKNIDKSTNVNVVKTGAEFEFEEGVIILSFTKEATTIFAEESVIKLAAEDKFDRHYALALSIFMKVHDESEFVKKTIKFIFEQEAKKDFSVNEVKVGDKLKVEKDQALIVFTKKGLALFAEESISERGQQNSYDSHYALALAIHSNIVHNPEFFDEVTSGYFGVKS